MNLHTLKSWQIHVIGVLLCAVLTAGAYYGIAIPVMARQQSVASVRQQWDQYRQRSAQLEAHRRTLIEDLKATYEALDASRVKLESSEMLNTRIAEVTDLATECRLDLHQTSSRALAGTELYDTISISIAGGGTYSDAARFLHRLRERMPDTGVRSVRLTGNPRSPQTPARYEMDLVWYTAPVIVSAVE